MVKLDANQLRYLSNDDVRVLVAVEMGMKNHQLVPGTLVSSIGALKHGGTSKILHNLTRSKLLIYERGKRYDGYRLSFLGYDYLALHALSKRGSISQIGNQIGVGKESDVYIAVSEEKERYAVKLHRLGRTCFRKVQEKRDYHKGNNKVHNWIYLSRLAATREFSFLKALHERSLPVPKPIDSNRHCIIMELVEGTLLNNFTHLDDPATLYDDLMNLILSLANDHGVVHGDFNEFNIMLQRKTLKPVLIDFPQMISVTHQQAKEYFQRDVQCIVNLFKRFDFQSEDVPDFDRDVIIERGNSEIISSKIHVPGEDISDYVSLDREKSQDQEDEEEKYESSQERKIDSQDCGPSKLTSEGKERARNESVSSSSDSETNCQTPERSHKTYSIVGSTFTTNEIRSKLKKEAEKRTKREEIRRAIHGVKGEDCAVRRQRRMNREKIRDDADWDASFF